MNHISDRFYPLDEKGNLSIDFVKSYDLRVVLLAGAPSVLESSLIADGLSRHGQRCIFEIYDEDTREVQQKESNGSLASIIGFLYRKFSRPAIIRSKDWSMVVFFHSAAEYFIVMSNNEDWAFPLSVDAAKLYFLENITGDLNETHLKRIWSNFEPYM